MKLKNILLLVVGFVIGATSLYVIGDKDHETGAAQAGSEIQEYTCSMHPQVRMPEPGKCPICAMDLIPVENDGAEDLPPGRLRLSSAAVQLAEIATHTVTRRSAHAELHLYGKIAIDEARQSAITAWTGGRIEELFVAETGRMVAKGQPLLKLYSPELYTAQQEFIEALENPGVFDLGIMRKKLELLGLSPQQLSELETNKKASEFVVIEAPISGIVLVKDVVEGEYVKLGSPLYHLADLSSVWAYLELYEKDAGLIEPGQKLLVKAEALPGLSFPGVVDLIEPILDRTARIIRVRAEIKNHQNRLIPGMFISATVKVDSGDELLVPASALLRTGRRAVVYVTHGDGEFEGREIELGRRVGDFFVVQNGLVEGEAVVVNGQFKIDSEMQIRAQKSMMNPSGEAVPVGHQHGGETAAHASPSQQKMNEQHDHAGHDSPANGHSPEIAGFVEQLDPVYNNYFLVQKALSHDKLADSQQPASGIAEVINTVVGPEGAHKAHWQMLAGKIKNAADAISKTKNIAIARAEFKELSDALIETAQVFGTSGNVTLKIFHCPMAFNDTGANWLQNFDDVENPYFGAEMFSCGWREKTLVEKKGGQQ